MPRTIGSLTLGAIAAMSLLLASATGAQTPPAPPNPATGVVTSIKAAPAPAPAKSSQPAAAAGEQPARAQGPDRRRWVIRVRLDNGTYRGFRQDNSDNLRVGERVFIENDRLQRERRAAQAGEPVKP